jgi:FAD:protein FMN transferase
VDAAKRTLAFDTLGVELDFGAIGIGYAVDRAVEKLHAAGVACAPVSSSKSGVYALGAPPGKQGWAISVGDPLDRRQQACSLQLRNLSISISGDYEKSFLLDGRLYTHILGPRTGRPVEQMLMTVVVADSNTASNALSTDFFVAGKNSSRAFFPIRLLGQLRLNPEGEFTLQGN